MPTHLERICSAVNQLPSNLDFEVSQSPGVQSEEATRLSQDMGSLLSEPCEIAWQTGQEENELVPFVPQAATPDTSVTQGERQEAAKKAKKNLIMT